MRVRNDKTGSDASASEMLAVKFQTWPGLLERYFRFTANIDRHIIFFRNGEFVLDCGRQFDVIKKRLQLIEWNPHRDDNFPCVL